MIVKELTVVCPLKLEVPYKKLQKPPKRYYLNMNNYRNWQHHVNNNLKKLYKEAVRGDLEGVVLETPVDVEARLYKGSKRKMDKGNVYAVQSKFLYDAMTEFGVWEDDNDEFVKTETILPTEYDKENPRIEFYFKPAC